MKTLSTNLFIINGKSMGTKDVGAPVRNKLRPPRGPGERGGRGKWRDVEFIRVFSK